MNYKGTILSIGETQTITDKFSKREFTVSDKTETYPQTIAFEMQGNNCSKLDNFRVGSLVDIEFNLRGKENKGRVWNTLVAWKLTNVQVDAGNSQPPVTDDAPF